jgi:hypothetical protein
MFTKGGYDMMTQHAVSSASSINLLPQIYDLCYIAVLGCVSMSLGGKE